MKKKILGVILLILGLYIMGTKIYPNSIEEAMKEVNIRAKQILHKIEIDKGMVVFYEESNQLNGCNVGLIEKKLFRYKWVFGIGTAYFNEDKDLTWSCGSIGKSSERGSDELVYIAYGTIINSDIKEVEIKLEKKPLQKAEIVETNLGRIWYAFIDPETSRTPEIVGKSADGEIIFKRP